MMRVKTAMKRSWLVVVVIAPALLFGSEKQTCPAASSTLRLTRSLAPVYQQLSANAEAVAPSARHRAVAPPAKSPVV